MSGFLGVLRNGAMIAAVAGGAGSVAYVLRAGHPPSLLLIALFVGWVFSPFAGLIAANIVSTRGSVVTQTTLHAVTLILAVLSLIIYGNDGLRLPGMKPAAIFLMLPLASWLFMATVIPIVVFVSGRWRSR